MIKRILGGAAAAALTATLLTAGSASAHQCTTGTGDNPNNRSADKIADTTGGGYVYGTQSGPTSGYVGIQGGNGWLEAGGSTGGVYVKGHTKGAPSEVDGYIDSSAAKKVCVNGTKPA